MHSHDTAVERWLPVVGHEGRYEVSDQGRVRQVGYGAGITRGRILKTDSNRGHLRVTLHNGQRGDSTRIFVHALVMAAFVGPRPTGYHINHKNFERGDNCLPNLEYMTPSENTCYSRDAGRVSIGTANGRALLTEDDVRKIRRLRGQVTATALAKRYGVTQQLVSEMHMGHRWKHLLKPPE